MRQTPKGKLLGVGPNGGHDISPSRQVNCEFETR